jgi:hypothetical protein
MKKIVLSFAALASLAIPAHAGPCGAKPCTAEEINRALQWLGRPEHEQIGHSRVLHDDGAVRSGETRQTIRIQRDH